MKLWRLFRARQFNTDIEDEVRCHLEMRADSHVRAGMSREDAMALAQKKFGNVDAIKRAMRGARTRHAYALAGVTGAVLVVIMFWLIDYTRSGDLPRLPEGMKFVSGPPPAP